MATKDNKQGKKQGKVGKGNPPVATRFKKGESGNPKGRPKGISITSKVKAMLAEIEPKSGMEYQDLLVLRMMETAVSKGNTKMMELIWNYMDGKPNQFIDMKVEDKTIPAEDKAKIEALIKKMAKKK